MIIDTSLIIAILRDEPDAAAMGKGKVLARAQIRRMSAASYVEAAVVVDSNRNPALSRRLIGVEPVTLNAILAKVATARA
jgi:ribonuclease VapC